MRTKSNSRSRWVARSLAVLGGSVLLSACGTPVSPTAVESPELAAVASDEGGRATKSGSRSNLRPCRHCDPVIDPGRVPPYKDPYFSLFVMNTGDARVDEMQVAVALVGADGRRRLASVTAHTAPRPGETVALRLQVAVPHGTPDGLYAIEAVLDPGDRIAESDETDNTWLSGERVAIVR